jgi:hypothetical protein
LTSAKARRRQPIAAHVEVVPGESLATTSHLASSWSPPCHRSASSPARGDAGAAGGLEDIVIVRIAPNDKGNPPGKLADAELHFTEGALEGLKLIGFGIWERRGGTGRNVTFPARQYSVNGERRSFALLRPVTDPNAQERIRDLVLRAYEDHEAQAAVAS